MKIAQYRYIDSQTTCIFPADFERHGLRDTVRISEYVEVEFTPRDPAAVVAETCVLVEVKRARLRHELAKLDGETA